MKHKLISLLARRTKRLDENSRKQHTPQHSHISTREACGESKLERTTCLDGHVTRTETEKQRDSGKRVGVAAN